MSKHILSRTNLPSGIIFFSQAHSLRWLRSGISRPEVLWLEILSHSLLFRHLVIQDSYLIQNFDLYSNWASQRHELETLIKEGIIIVAQRQGSTFVKTTWDQWERKVPTLWDDKEQPLPALAIEYGQFLDHCSRNGLILEWNIEEMREHFLHTCLNEVLADHRILRTLGLDDEIADKIRSKMFNINDDGLLSAQRVYDLSGWKNPYAGDPLFRQYSDPIKVMATWIHNLHFPVLLELPISFSPLSLDAGASELYLSRHIPTLADSDILRRVESFSEAGEIISGGGSAPILLRRGLKPILRLRQSSEFEKLQQTREKLYKNMGSGNRRFVEELKNALDDAMIAYADCIWREFEADLVDSPRSQVASVILQDFEHRHGGYGRQLELRWAIANLSTIGLSIASSYLASLGVPVHIATLAILPTLAAGALEVWQRRRLTKKMSTVDNAQRLFGVIQADPNPLNSPN